MPRNLCALIGALCTLAVPCTDTQAGDRGGPAAAGDRPGRHVEVRGVRQFSGRLIVRPRQHEDWVKRGASDNEAAQRSAVARSFLATYPIRRYIAETDEYVSISSEFRALAHLPGVADADIFEPRPEEIYSWKV